MAGSRCCSATGSSSTCCTSARGERDRGPEVYRFLRDDCGARFMQFIPIIERATPSAADREPGLGQRQADRPLYVQEGALRHRALGHAEQYGRSCRRLRRVGAARRRRGLRADLRRRAGELGRRAAGLCVSRRPAASRSRSSTTATSTRATTSSSRGTARQHRSSTCSSWSRSPQQRRSASTSATPAALLPRLRRALRLPRRLPEGPLHRRPPTASRASTTCAPATRTSSTTSTRHAAHGAAPGGGRAPSEIVGSMREDAEAGPQRPLHLRQRPQVEAVPRRWPGAAGFISCRRCCCRPVAVACR